MFEAMIERLLLNCVVKPMSENAMLRCWVNARYENYHKGIVIEAKIWNSIRKIAERSLDECQKRAKRGRLMRAA
jgi:hypothetical protein